MWNLYEDPWLLLIIGVVTLIAGAMVRNQLSGRKGFWVILAGVLIAVGGVGLDYFIKTDYEQIEWVVDTCRDAVIARDIRPIAPLVCASYRDSVHFDRQAFIDAIDGVIQSAAVSKIRFREKTIELLGGAGHASIKATVFLDTQSSYAAAGGLFFVEMSVDFRRENQQWLLAGAEVDSVNNTQVNWKAAH